MRFLVRGWVAMAALALAAFSLAISACSDPVDPIEAAYQLRVDNCAGDTTGFATAIAFEPDMVASVGHTLNEFSDFTLLDSSGHPHPAELVYLDVDKDIAIFRLTEPVAAHLPLGEPESETDIQIALFDRDVPSLQPATITKTVTITLDGEGSRRGMRITSEIERGDSGAGIIAEGEIVGIVFATDRSDPNEAWAVSATEITDAVATLSPTSRVPPTC